MASDVNSPTSKTAASRATLSVTDGVAMLVGIVVGIGIFKTPQLVALNVESDTAFLLAWLAGGAITLIGALVYAELGSTYPNSGGEYHFLDRAFGKQVSLLFAWARLTVIQTGAIAVVAFVFGDYAQQVVSLGPWSSVIYATAAIVVFTVINLMGTLQGKGTQLLFSAMTVSAVLLVAILAITWSETAPTPAPATTSGGSAALGLAMVMILLTYGGWNETAYISAELKDVRRNMARMCVIGIAVIVTLYLLVNWGYLHVLGLEGMRKSDAVGADAMRVVLGDKGALVLALAVCCAALSTLNGTIFTGARLYYSIGRELPLLGSIGRWETERNTPVNAIILQSVIALVLVGFGATARNSFQHIVEYTAPVFWFFLLLVGLSLFVLRAREPNRVRAFRVPLYPVTPIIFCATCAYLLYSSVVYTGYGALIGITVLLLGLPLLLLKRETAADADA